MPYRDVFDHKPPGVFLADAAAQSLLPWLDPWTPVWLLSVACAAGLGFAVVLALRASGYPRLAPWCGLATTATVAAFPVSYGGGQSELTAALPAAVAVLVLSDRRGWLVALATGVLLGLAVSISPHLAPAFVVGVGLALRGTDRVERCALLAVGSFAVGAAMVGWLVVGGAWPAATEALVTYNAAYRAANVLDPVVTIGTSTGVAFLAVAALFGVIALCKRSTSALFIGATVWIGLSIAMFMIESRLGAHYLASIAAPLGMLAGPGLASMRSDVAVTPIGFGRRAVQLSVLVASLALSVYSVAYFTRSFASIYDVRANEIQTAVARLRTMRGSGSVFVWGHAPEIYYESGLRPASRYVYCLPLMTIGYATPARVSAVADEIERSRPVAILDASVWGGTEVTAPVNGEDVLDRRSVDELEPLRLIVHQRYVPVGEVAEWPLYVTAP